MDYTFFQHYWWFLVSLLGALLVFLLFVQGGQTFIFSTKKDPTLQKMLINSTGRKWEFTLTTLVTFGGAFFASFPLFYSTSFGGAYWVWILICLCFVLQAVSYEYQAKHGNVWGKKTYHTFLFINGVLAPVLLGAAVSTFFTGGNFEVNKAAIFTAEQGTHTISVWQPYHGIQWHGVEALFNPWNVVLGLAVLFLARTTALLYFINNIADPTLYTRARKRLLPCAAIFVVLFIIYSVFLLTANGLTYSAQSQTFELETHKYLHNFLQMPFVLLLFLCGVAMVLFGILKTILCEGYKKGIWIEGFGVVLTVLAMLLVAGWNNTAYYPSLADRESSLALANSSSSFYTLKVMSVVSLLVPFVLAYIYYAWKSLDKTKITRQEMDQNPHLY